MRLLTSWLCLCLPILILSPGGGNTTLMASEATPPLYYFNQGAFAETPQWWDDFSAAIDLHDRGVEGDSNATEQAIERLEKMQQKLSEEGLVIAYLGSAFTLRARDAPLWRKQHWVNRGFELLDEAVKKDDKNPLIRLVRAINSYHMPKFLNREEFAEEDFAFLIEWLQTAESPESIPEAFRKAVYFHAGAFLLRNRDPQSIELLENALEITAAPELDPLIRQSLRQAQRRIPNVQN